MNYVAASGTSSIPVVCMHWKHKGIQVVCEIKRVDRPMYTVDRPMYTVFSKGSFSNQCHNTCSC